MTDREAHWRPIVTHDGTSGKVDLWVRSADRFWRITDCKFNQHKGWLEYRPDETERHHWGWYKIEAIPLFWMPIPAQPKETP